ncbi:MAG TPA: hypothetical protein VKX17_23640 [Planctomycetota bacterium]|nr:hypothetical protein [Planctomycetota bacterium]
MKAIFRSFLTILGIISLSTHAGIRPSFGLEECAWSATDIVVATKGDEIDGVVKVLEVWKGALHVGDMISVPDLASFKNKDARLIHDPPFLEKKPNAPAQYVTCTRMILFLKKKANAANAAKGADQPHDSWEGASFWKQISVSVVWVEGKQTYTFQQLINPGPSELVAHGDDEKAIKDSVLKLKKVQDELAKASAIIDKSKRAELLRPLTQSEIYMVKQAAFAELKNCGEEAMPTLRKMLADPKLLSLHEDVIDVLQEVGGVKVGGELSAILQGELKFWRATGPKLKTGWWNESTDVDPLRSRYGKALHSLYALKKIRFAGCKSVVTEFRDFWRSLPQLEDKSGLNQMSEECDNVLQSLP